MKRLITFFTALTMAYIPCSGFALLSYTEGECTIEPATGSSETSESGACANSPDCQIINLATTQNCGMGDTIRVFKKTCVGCSEGLVALVTYCTSSCGGNGFKSEQQPLPASLGCKTITNNYTGNDDTNRTFTACVKDCDDCTVSGPLEYVTANATYHTMKRVSAASCDRYTGICTKDYDYACTNGYYGTPGSETSTACVQCPKIYNIATKSTPGLNWSVDKCCLPENSKSEDTTGYFKIPSCCATKWEN